MAVQLPDKIYVDGAYLDANISVADITELSQKASSNGFFLHGSKNALSILWR